jgi:hypothetical protein
MSGFNTHRNDSLDAANALLWFAPNPRGFLLCTNSTLNGQPVSRGKGSGMLSVTTTLLIEQS